jgi:hypothetical protein
LFPDVLVVLPGIMGSVLEKDGRVLWDVSGSAMIRAIRNLGSTAKQLALAGDSPDSENLGDGIRATRLIKDVQLIPGFWKIDGYTKLASALQSAFELRAGENYFEFPYDWRRDNRASAGRLSRLARRAVTRWRERSGNADAKLCILAHSMGGLVARHFVECMEGWTLTRRLITFGTPFRGSLNALNILANGLSVRAVNLDSFSEMARTFTSVYQLLPQYQCYATGDGKLGRIGETAGIPNVDFKRAEQALRWHREMDDCAARNQKNGRPGYRLHPIVGAFQTTLQGARAAGRRVEMLTEYPGPNGPTDGDGTVSEVSAVPPEEESDSAVYVSQHHASIQNTDHVLEHVLKLLTVRDLSSIRGESLPESARLSLELSDLYTSSEPVAVVARAVGEDREVSATLQEASSGQLVAETRMQFASGAYNATFKPLGPGAYRLTAKDRSRAVTDVFAVVA